MTFLPIVERELRVASRRRFTFWGRIAAAAFALVIFGCLQLLAEMSQGMGFKAGKIQFSILKWLSFLFACSAGLFLTSDSLSEEKREGTLGLLFLTDLRGYDVVFGKLISHSLQAFFCLMAAFPIMGLTILAGGVTGAEFGSVMLVVCNTLFVSLCIGLFISSISRDVIKAINGTLLLGVVVFAGLPFADWCLASLKVFKGEPILSLLSPGFLFLQTGSGWFRSFWLCFGLQQALAWALLILASICTPHTWQEKSSGSNSFQTSFSHRWRFGGRNGRLRLRRRMLGREPLLWLTSRDRWLPRLVWSILGAGVVLLGCALYVFRSLKVLQVAGQVEWLLALGLLLWMAIQATRFFVDGIRSGALELILVAPIGPERIVRSQWSALWRTFLFPALLLVGIEIAAGIAGMLEMKQRMVGSKMPPGFNYYSFQIVILGVGIVKFIGNLAAVAWFGMWMGVTTRKVSLAVFKTLVFALVLPGLAILFLQGISMFVLVIPVMKSGGTSNPFWMSYVIAGVLSVAKNLFFILWSRRNLFTRFREAMMREGHRPRINSPPMPPVAPPPVPPPLVESASVGAT